MSDFPDPPAPADAAGLDEGPATEALLRFLDASWRTMERYPLALSLPIAPLSSPAQQERHRSVLARLERLVVRGQQAGDFDPALPPGWLLSASVTLGHAAAELVGADGMTGDEALDVLKRTVLRVFGVGSG